MPRFEDLPVEEQEKIKELGRQKKAQRLAAEKTKQVDIGEGIHGLKVTLTSDEDELEQQQNVTHFLLIAIVLIVPEVRTKSKWNPTSSFGLPVGNLSFLRC